MCDPATHYLINAQPCRQGRPERRISRQLISITHEYSYSSPYELIKIIIFKTKDKQIEEQRAARDVLGSP